MCVGGAFVIRRHSKSGETDLVQDDGVGPLVHPTQLSLVKHSQPKRVFGENYAMTWSTT